MNKLAQARARIGAALSTALLVPGVVFAQSVPPATATDLANSVDLTEAKTAAFIIFGLLIGVGVSMWVGRMIVAKFRPRA